MKTAIIHEQYNSLAMQRYMW